MAYKHGNGCVQHRDGRGRFAKPSLGCAICGDCGQLLLPETDWSTGVPVKKYPKECLRCGGVDIRT